jgi:YidC/Oxa1 family membrane protein insertase
VKTWQDWQACRRFHTLPARARNIVFYSETRADWHHLQPLIDALVDDLSRPVCHVTSEPSAALPAERAGLQVFRVRAGVMCTWLFQMLKADVMVMTMMDLHNFQLKRSVHPVHYVYVFHNMGSTHMVDHADSYDHYDSIFCVGPHQEAEIRRREALAGLRPKHLVAHGYPRLDALIEAARGHPPRPPVGNPTVLLAPTWGEQSTLDVCGDALIASLLGAGVNVILRPHYQTARLSPGLLQGLLDRFGTDPGFRHVEGMGDNASLLESDVLISDWSSMAIEYALALGKPVLFVDVPPRVRNPKYAELGLEPLEFRIRRELGTILPLDRVPEAPKYVAELLRDAGDFRARVVTLRQEWAFNVGRSAAVGAREIARLADERAGTAARGLRS